VYAIPLGGTLVKVPYTIGGSGSAYITGWCDKHFREDFTEAEAHAFVVQALTHAIARDASSGGCIRTVTITSDGPKRTFLPGDKVGRVMRVGVWVGQWAMLSAPRAEGAQCADAACPAADTHADPRNVWRAADAAAARGSVSSSGRTRMLWRKV
jgi:hypothetical protein